MVPGGDGRCLTPWNGLGGGEDDGDVHVGAAGYLNASVEVHTDSSLTIVNVEDILAGIR